MLGRWDGSRIAVREVHRFSSGPVRLPGGLFCDVPRIWREIVTGLGKARESCEETIDAVGVDAWGVDFALLDGESGLLGLPHHYRDELSSGMDRFVFETVPKREVFAATGNQWMPINSLYQLVGLRQKRPSFLAAARRLVFIPDLFTQWLGGDDETCRTIASTSQCYDPATGDWADSLFRRLELPRHLFGAIREPGVIVGELQGEARATAGLGPARVLAPAGHDTALAVAAAPASGAPFAYVILGTWCLVGTELAKPVVSEEVFRSGFTNEMGVFGTVRLLKNVCGLWLLQESRRCWASSGADYSFAELEAAAEAAAAWTAVVDVDTPSFARPGDLPARIAAQCADTHQAVPHGVGAMVRVVLESLALKIRYTLEAVEALGGPLGSVIHLVGGGARSSLLCQLIADATGRLVLAGPAEATAIGNVLMQAVGLGALASLADLREIVRRSFRVVACEPAPRASPALEERYRHLRQILQAHASTEVS